ncbi:MAG TPA: outer membrane lipoprotein carrier protein LolA [Bacteroidia bacterium]|nr:outer membrane lipoprotein carrier protein LolA [Bacteroidia bacterium]
MLRTSFVILSFFLFSGILCAQKELFRPMKDTSAFRQKIDVMAKSTQSIESDFQQVKELSALTEKVTSKGHFCFKKENLLRWEYTTPYKYMILINKDKILIKDEARITRYDMNSNKIFKEINDIMIASVQGNILKSGKFRVVFFENEKGYKLELYPLAKGMKESLKKINMYFDKAVSSVMKIEMEEPSGDSTIIDFMNKKLNGDIPASKFILN